VDGDFIRLIVDGIGTNSSLQKEGYPIIGDGLEYDINGTIITSTKITWYIDDEYATLDKSVISFSLTKRSCDTAPPININTADIFVESSANSNDEGIIGGIPGFEFVAVISSLLLTSFVRRKV